MSGDDDEYRFDPAAFDEGGESPGGFDPVPAVIGSCVAVGGALFLAEPYVDPLPVGGVGVPAVLLSVVVVAGGLLFGCVAFLRRERWRLGLAHGVGGVGWTLVALGTVVPSGVLLLAGFAVLVGGCVGLVAMAAGPSR